MSIVIEPEIIRTEFGFQRTTCDCKLCVTNCVHIPGYLIPHDLLRLLLQAGFTEGSTDEEVIEWARHHLLVSPGALVVMGEVVRRIRTLVPNRVNNRCRYLSDDNRCTVHAISPYGCAFFDEHMSPLDGHIRASWGLHAILEDEKQQGFYTKVVDVLWREDLVQEAPELRREALRNAREKMRREGLL